MIGPRRRCCMRCFATARRIVQSGAWLPLQPRFGAARSRPTTPCGAASKQPTETRLSSLSPIASSRSVGGVPTYHSDTGFDRAGGPSCAGPRSRRGRGSTGVLCDRRGGDGRVGGVTAAHPACDTGGADVSSLDREPTSEQACPRTEHQHLGEHWDPPRGGRCPAR